MKTTWPVETNLPPNRPGIRPRRASIVDALFPALPAWVGFFLVISVQSLCAQENTAPPTNSATVLEIQGNTWFMPAGATRWIDCHTNQVLYPGDQFKTGDRSRATLKLYDGSLQRLNPRTRYRYETAPDDSSTAWFEVWEGILYFFRRGSPVDSRYRTPRVSAAVRGTEFNLEVRENGETIITMIDGVMQLTDLQSQTVMQIESGERCVVQPGLLPSKERISRIEIIDAIQWCLYYPGVLDLDELGLDEESQPLLAESLAAYRSGHLVKALVAYPLSRQPSTETEKVYLAALLLAVGEVSQADVLLKSFVVNELRDHSSTNEERLARAIQRLISIVKVRGAASIQRPQLASEWLVESYYQQSVARIPEALDAAKLAVKKSPGFGFGWARIAELEFCSGRTREALEALEKSLNLAPSNAQAIALQGFVLAAQDRVSQAILHFEQAMAIDRMLGNAWLGRGLCRIRRGDTKSGLEDLQMATAMEPQRALLRSYLGKGLFEGSQKDKAMNELNLAKFLDPGDPTAWLYSALLRQNQNLINDAIEDVEKSKLLNDNRSLFRSRLLLDQDIAIRSVNLAGLYRDAGMTEFAVQEASRAVDSDYANASAHLFLANASDALRDPHLINLRYETAWYSELLLANLLAPPGMGVLSQNISQQEYSRLFDRHRLGLVSATEYNDRGDWIQTASQYGYYGRLSYTLDVQYRDENGQRINEDRTLISSGAQIKIQLTPQDSVVLMAGTLDYESGDLRQYYNPDQARKHLRVEEYQDPNLFVGYHREWRPGSHTLLLFGRLDDTLHMSDPDSETLLLVRNAGGLVKEVVPYPNPYEKTPFDWDYERQIETYSAELQQIWQLGDHTIIAGGKLQSAQIDVESILQTSDHPRFYPRPLIQASNENFERASLYLYDQWQIKAVRLYGGLTYDYLKYPVNVDWAPIMSCTQTEDQFSPKAGLLYSIGLNTHFHAAWTRSLGGAYYDQSLRLEPTRIAGFNQAFRSLVPEATPSAASGLIPGAHFETWGLALDHQFPTRTYMTLQAELLQEEADRSLGAFENVKWGYAVPSSLSQKLEYREQSLAITVNQLAGRDWSLGISYRACLADLSTRYPGVPATAQQLAWDTFGLRLDEDSDTMLHEVRLSVRFNHPSGFFGCLEPHWHCQENGGDMAYMQGDNFWQTDAWIGCRFWRRQVMAQLGLLNVFDQDYRLNPLNLHQNLSRERTFVCQVRLEF